jgi:hypothetical protein
MVSASGDSTLSKVSDVITSGLFLTRAQIDHIYGQPGSAIGYWGRRLWRLVEMSYRLCRYSWAYLRHRKRT